ncbi:MAG TPA: peptidoglycan DD-metalloendopeptidase family protein [Steroidobacteraceae bacterium]|nr:peptidoglycan DD-metalloendopeptidase family protein [Steroidobacteraceae bacterium]
MPRNIFGYWKNASRIKVLATCLAVSGTLAGAAFLALQLSRPDDPIAAAPQGNIAAPVAPAGSAVPPPPPIAAQQASVASIIEVVVGRNDTLDGIFRRMSLNKSDLAAIRSLPGIRQSLDFLKPGDSIKLTHTDGDIKGLTRKVSETQTLEVVRQDGGFEAKMIENPVEVRVRTARAVIDSSLFQAAGAADISDTVALKLANVFGWDIDFVLDIREGDRFTAVYEQVYQDGKYLRDGEVLAAEFVNNGKVFRAVRFVADNGSTGYYTPNGLAMRKAFLRAPVEFTRVSSAFNPHRHHPILNLIRGHMGTDYAAPVGTPVHAAGDGHVSFEGRRGGYGNAIVLTHGANVSTLYGHMSRFARNVHVGTRVSQGEVIGYVGMTGLATGPHLHYEYLTNGVHRNPQTVQLPGAEPLRAQDLQRFRELSAPLLADLAPPQPPAAVASAAPAPGSASTSTAAGTTPNATTPNATTLTGTAPTGATPTANAAAGSGNASLNSGSAPSKASVN